VLLENGFVLLFDIDLDAEVFFEFEVVLLSEFLRVSLFFKLPKMLRSILYVRVGGERGNCEQFGAMTARGIMY
jgi:hypothetical protein